MSNVNSKKEKRDFDPLCMNKVHSLTYNLKSLKPGENKEKDWRKYWAPRRLTQLTIKTENLKPEAIQHSHPR